MTISVGARIAEARRAKGLTQGQLAQAIGASSNMAVSRWERGEIRPSATHAVALARALGTTVEELLAEEPHPPTVAPTAPAGESAS